ncbi:MAG: McrC family protein, partial [Nannocystaceae bacterium]
MALCEESLHTLAQLGHLVEVRPHNLGWTVKPKGIVGRIQLQEGAFNFNPKLPITNLCRMIAAVAQVPRLFESSVVLGDGSLPDLLIATFVQQTEKLLLEGLRREYIERRERLAVLRGRLDLPAHLRRPEALVTDLSCRHVEYSLDTPFNAVLRQTAEVCQTRWPPLRARMLHLRHRLAVLPKVRLRPEDIDCFSYSRLTEAYRPVHALCRQILQGTQLGLNTTNGTAGGSFIVEVAPLFERFVSRSLQNRLGPPWRVKLQERVALDREHKVEIRPDIVVYHHKKPVAVLDAKYKLRRHGVPKNNSDVYQALAYAQRYATKRVWLIFPDQPRGESILVSHDGNREVVSVGLDLGGDWTEVERAFD